MKSTPTLSHTPSPPTQLKISDNALELGQFYFNYARYHYNPINKRIHMIFIPILVFTIFAMGHHGFQFKFSLGGEDIIFDIGLILTTLVIPVYYVVDIATGLATTVFGLSAYFGSVYLYEHNWQWFNGNHLQYMVALHVLSWIVQFIGHGIYEKRKPALLENILNIFAAPFFFVFEVLYRFGYKRAEVKEWNKVIASEVDAYRKSNKIK